MGLTNIQWADYTFNPWIGCTKVDQGCAHCYAEGEDKRRGWTDEGWGKEKPRHRTGEANWRGPLVWDRGALERLFVRCTECGRREMRKWDSTLPPGGLACCSTPGCLALPETEADPVRPRVFCASLADWLDDEVPIEWLADLLKLIQATPNLDWLLLTKRPENWEERFWRVWTECEGFGDSTPMGCRLFEWLTQNSPPSNVWLGTSVSDQASADKRVPLLLDIPAVVRFLSCEPMLGPVDLVMPGTPHDPLDIGGIYHQPKIHWVICGGESGPDARPMHPDWARALRDQCQAAGVPFFLKQWGEWLPVGHGTKIPVFDLPKKNAVIVDYDRRIEFARVGKHRAGRLLDGVIHGGFPASQFSKEGNPS